ncbi:TPA: hypothetical protein ACNH39_004156 [Serratia marcescens]
MSGKVCECIYVYMVMMMLHKIQVSARDKIAEYVQSKKDGFYSYSESVVPLEMASVVSGVCSGRTEHFPSTMSKAEKYALTKPPSANLKNNPIDDPLFYTIGEVLRKHALNINERIQKELKTDDVILLSPLEIILNNKYNPGYTSKVFSLDIVGKLASKSESMILNEGFRDLASELSDFQLAIAECVAGLVGDGIVAVHKSKSFLSGIYDTSPDKPEKFFLEIYFTVASEAYELARLERAINGEKFNIYTDI